MPKKTSPHMIMTDSSDITSTLADAISPPLKNLKPSNTANKCDHCHQSKCCRYAVENINSPRSMRDFDTLLWQVSHKAIHIYKDSNGWHMLVMSDCEHLLDNGMCGIYEVRPFICREHDNTLCDFDMTLRENTDLYFLNYAEMDNYCRKRFKFWDKRFE